MWVFVRWVLSDIEIDFADNFSKDAECFYMQFSRVRVRERQVVKQQRSCLGLIV